ncbi:hypothetical protein OE749_14450 [Aestuariibacter sp. AA17]|uniref:DUF4402 domain-containing protein n=1 Tax=Fluctibacter corallii TaxID=2984329 RepID=A0ABT3AB46_9ALTE|nr:DUF4402 domain-containing protein [Aestuariibacter sp. AA17]MCV2885896.1 hypothetical protein [Aestuariibacter sp. AA17]
MLRNNLKLAGVSAIVLGALATSANAETLTVPATVAVDNSINFTLTGSLDFGIVRATVDNTAGNCVGITLPANPASALNSTLGTAAAAACTGAGTAVLQNVGGTPARPSLQVAGLAPFTALTLTLPAAPVDLVLNPAPTGAPVLRLFDFTAYQTSGTPAAVTTTVTADASGAIAFNVGATLTTDPGTPTLTYENTTYTGDFDVTVTY